MKLNTALSTLVAAGAAFAATSVQAVVFPDFTVNPAPYSAKAPFVADKITGNYVEDFTFVPSSASAGSFNVSLLFNAGQFVKDDGATPLTAAVTGLNFDYGLYALFMGSGTYSTTANITTFNVTPGSGSFNVFIDQGANNTFANPGMSGTTSFVATNPSGPGDIQIVQNGIAVAGSGRIDGNNAGCGIGAGGGGINCGSFGQTTNFPLTLAGSAFFFDPKPFYGLSFQSGQLNNIDPALLTQRINGSLDVVFAAVPEPTSLALVGLSLLGLCFVQRRKS